MFLEYLKKYKEEIKKSIEDLKHKDTVYRQIPNLLTFLRLVGGLPAGLIYFLNPYISIGAIVFLWLTDAIDGPIARKFGIQSKLGADMDTVADKIMFLASAVPLLGNTPILIVNFVNEGIISGINVVGRIKGLNTKTVLLGKIKTVSLALTLMSGYFAQFLGMPAVIFHSLMPITTVFQFLAIKDYILEFRKMDGMLEKNSFNSETDEEVDNNLLDESNSLDKTLTLNMSPVDELRNMKSLILGSIEPDRISKPNKRTRNILEESNKNKEH